MRSIGSAASCASMVASVPRTMRSSGQEARTTIGDRAIGAVERRQLGDDLRRARGWRDGSRASRRSRPKAASVSPRGIARGAAGDARQHQALRDLRAWSARGRARRRRRRKRARPASACRGCRAAPAGGAARRRALQIDRSPECSRATSWPVAMRRDEFGLDLVERQRRGVDDARARRAMRSSSARHDRAGIEADRAARDQVAPAQVMRSAAPGPAPMKCTVMASPRLASAQVTAPTTMRGRMSRARRPCRRPSAAASATDGTPASASTRLGACRASARRGASSAACVHAARASRPSAAAARGDSAPRSRLLAGGARAASMRVRRDRPARSSAACERRVDLARRPRPCGSRCPRDDHGFTHAPLRHRHGRPPAGHAPTGVGARRPRCA